MLRKFRISLSLLTITIITLLFLGVNWFFVSKFAWMAKIQFLPAVLSLNIIVLAVIFLCTLILGRFYCSVVCPLGISQDAFAWIGKKSKKNRYFHSAEKKWLRYGVLAVFILCLIIGFTPVTALLAPYSTYGRFVNSVFKPLYDIGQNKLAILDESMGTFYISNVDIWLRSITATVISLLTLVVLFILAWRNGRTYCNTLCPVGTVLSFFSRFSLLRVQLDKTKCHNCSLCEKNCKAAAIDFKNGIIDYSRCVVCGDCIDKCQFDALHYKPYRFKKIGNPSKISHNASSSDSANNSRRSFLLGLTGIASTLALAQSKKKVDGGLTVIEKKEKPYRETAIVPPGSVSIERFSKHCTACQLCVSSCPNNVLRPSTDPLRFMQPESSYERGWCRPECTRCSQVCPTDAISLIDRARKTSIHVGHAVWIKANCIPINTGDSCGSCAQHCPSHAIFMVDHALEDGHIVKVPSIEASRCIGCGACEYLCPARPFSAIYVEGNKQHIID